MASTALPTVQGTTMERDTRTSCGFAECEHTLPNIKRAPPGDSGSSLAEDVLSHLGKWNPMARPITAEDTLWMLDNTAYRDAASGQWQADFVAAVFQQDTGVGIDDVVAAIAEKLGIAKDDAVTEVIRQRIDYFTRDILPGRKVEVQYQNHGREKKLELGPGGRNAISSDVKNIPEGIDGETATNKAVVPQGTDGIIEFKTHYAEPEGWGVISDIDDTIKVTQTTSPLGILKSTFVSRPTPITGMPELYAWMKTLLEPDAKKTPLWFYLSASPYNLYPFLRTFRDAHYPAGTIVLRDASWMNLGGLLSNLTLGVQDYKVDRMQKIQGWLPKRKMICIGDSTQSDPEAYAEIYRKHPGWIHLILIRKVEAIAGATVAFKTQPARFEKAFKDVPRSAWKVFTTPDECRQMIEEVVAAGGKARL